MPPAKDNSAERKKIAEHVVKHIDEALETGWVKVFYQPVIRALTGQLCGAESLARWIDPELGFLYPDLFIGALEDSNQIHKLDCWIVRKVCSDISERIHNGLDAVPVSVNFSRLDFESTDMLKVLEDAVDEYDIPRDYIHVEITESMIVSDAELMSTVIESFRSTGYEVWMDDFGSGYSSLTLLKDYHFDTLKLDMEFLRSFTDRSKAIITSTITMSKEIDIKTLAEGVETAEQVEFLKNIGCGRLQGYFYGKPMPIDEFFAHMRESKIDIEKRQWRHYNDVVSLNARRTDESLALIEDDNGKFRTLFMNDVYKLQIFEKPYSLEMIDQIVFNSGSPLAAKLEEFARNMEQSKNLETFYFTSNGNIFCLKGKEIAENAGSHVIMNSIRNISSDDSITKHNTIESRLKELNHIFDSVAHINPSKNSIYPLVGKYRYVTDIAIENTTLDILINEFKENFVALSDTKKFEEFCDWTTLNDRIKASSKGFIENIFKIKQENGNYELKGISLMLIPSTEGKEFLLCIKSTPDDIDSILSTNKNIYNPEDYGLKDADSAMYAKMWVNTVTTSHLKFFWKDKNRRFLGASRSFLDFYGFTIDDIYGKDDEDMGWHVDGKIYRDDELDVLSKGAIIANVPGNCIVKGVLHNIMCFKSPIYDGTEIIGLMGYFIDVDEELQRMDSLFQVKRLDHVTSLMNGKAFMDVLMDYASDYNENGTDYALIILRNTRHDRIISDYGKEFADKVLKRMSEEILKSTAGSIVAARVTNSDFAMLSYTTKQSELDMLTEKIKTAVNSIKEIDGNKLTLKVSIAAIARSDKESTDENMYQKLLDRMKEQA